ncbi:MAG: alpha/beta hydrolase [Candidatus Babeliales bacterium]
MNYKEQEVTYENKIAKVTLAGTLTTPQGEGPFPVVLLISGMGRNDRDYDICGHKLFLVLANHLIHHGIAVLRVDKRGVGKSTGTLDAAVTSKDLADDVFAGIAYLKTCKAIDHKKIGLIGHSEGGLIATMVATESKDVAFLVSMAGALTTGVAAVVEAMALQLRADGASKAMIEWDRKVRSAFLTIARREMDITRAETFMREAFAFYWAELSEALKNEACKLVFTITQANANAMISLFNSPWYRFLLSYRSVDALKQIKIPMLAITGSLDWITPASALSVIAKALERAGNRDCTTIELPHLNHQLRTCKTGSIAEYKQPGESIAPIALKVISDWIVERTSNRKKD